MGLRDEKKAELRRQIRNTALRLFGEEGITGTRVGDIVALLRISEATFFNYFPSKQAICEEAVTDLITQAMDQAFADGDAPVAVQLSALTNELTTQLTADRPLITLLRRQPELIMTGYFRLDHPASVLAARIEKAQADGEVRDDLPAEVISEACLGTILMTVGRAVKAGLPPSELGAAVAQAHAIWAEGCALDNAARGWRRRRARQMG